MEIGKWNRIKEVVAAALELPASQRSGFLKTVSDPEIREQAERLARAHSEAGQFIEKSAIVEEGLVLDDESDDPLIGQSIGGYRIVERIGIGGMGTVYRAERTHSDVKQFFALKLIKRGMDSEAIIRRFARERKILATLKHPNIAGLIDGGITSDGRPYFVMEYVEGAPLNKYRQSADPALHAVLGLFGQICSAVDHAHRNLIIHRDLKPSNIIISSDGTAKLLDFGIAKLISDDSENAETTIQSSALTPEYASPEQILGKPVSTATDVYSLGVILYELLCGKRPYDLGRGSFGDLVRSITETEPTPPSSVVDRPARRSGTETAERIVARTDAGRPRFDRRSIAGDLDNIVLKALQKDPSERYASVGQFSDDITRFLQGMPVLARPQTAGYRFGKFVRRHRAGVLASCLILVSLLAGTSIATWQAIVARRERARADRRFSEVRKIATAVIFDYHDKIRNLPDSTELGERMLSDTIVYLDQLYQEGSDDGALQLELARAYEKVGDIQGNTANANRMRLDAAKASYLKALALNESAVAKMPGDVAVQNQLARSFRSLANIERIKGNLDESVSYFGKTADAYRRSLEIAPGDVTAIQGLAWSQINIATQREEPDQVAESLRICRESVEMLERLAADEPDNETYQNNLPAAYDALADVMMAVPEKRSEALSVYRKSLELLNRKLEGRKNDINILERIATMHAYIADALYLTGRPDEAIAAYDESIARFDRLVALDAKNDYAVFLRAYVKTLFGRFLVARNQSGRALRILEEPLAVLPGRIAQDPDEAVTDFLFAIANQAFANAKSAAKQCPDATDHLKKSIAIYSKYFDRVVIPRMSARELSDEATKSLSACR